MILDNRDHIYAGGGNFTSPKVLGDLWASLDGGDTWRRTGLTDVIVNKIAVDPTNRDIFYAGCGYSGRTSTNHFTKARMLVTTWNPADNGLPAQTNSIKRSIWAESENNVYAAGDDGHLISCILTACNVDELLSGGTNKSPGT